MTDKVLPQAVDLERAVLGAILIDESGYPIASNILKPKNFYNDDNAKVFEAFETLYAQGKKIDILTVKTIIPDYWYLSELMNNIASVAHIETHAAIIFQKYVAREIIRITGNAGAEAYEGDVWELLNQVENSLQDIRGSVSLSECKSITTSVLEHLNKPKGFSGITTGFRVLNKPTNGWKESNLYIIAARPGMGKTAWMLQSALAAAMEENPVLIYSIEMGEEQIINRLVSLISGVEHEKIIKHNLTPTEADLLQDGYEKLSALPIFIDYSSVQNAKDFIHKTRGIKRKRGIKAVYVDYLQKMKSHEDNKVIEIGTIAATLKNTAKDLSMPVIALAQLSREVEKSSSKRPELSHLRESGRIEEEADLVAFLYRAFYYYQQGGAQFETIDIGGAQVDSRNYGEIIISKNRHGILGSIYLKFKGEQMQWSDMQEVPKREPHFI